MAKLRPTTKGPPKRAYEVQAFGFMSPTSYQTAPSRGKK